MRSIIIIKGLVKKDKIEWIHEENLENFFIDLWNIKRLYSTPEVSYSGAEVLGNCFSTEVNISFINILCSRMRKGGLLVIDTGDELGSTIEDLAIVFGYKVFYKVFPIPQDYLSRPKKYTPCGYKTQKRSDLESGMMKFLNMQLTDGVVINTYDDIVRWWENSKNYEIDLEDTDTVLHISDLHSNSELLKQVDRSKYDYLIYHGDYIDGPETGGSRKLIDYVISEGHKDNTIFLEGNHEMRLRRYLGGIYFRDKHKDYISDILMNELPDDFMESTGQEFSDIRGTRVLGYLQNLNDILRTHIILYRDTETMICTHSGLKNVDTLQPKYIGGVIYGNRDMGRFDSEFSRKYYGKSIYSIHAHCKYPDRWEPKRFKGVYNIDPEDETKIVLMENKTWKLWQLEK